MSFVKRFLLLPFLPLWEWLVSYFQESLVLPWTKAWKKSVAIYTQRPVSGKKAVGWGKYTASLLRARIHQCWEPYSKSDVFVVGFMTALGMTLVCLVMQVRYYELYIRQLDVNVAELASQTFLARKEADTSVEALEKNMGPLMQENSSLKAEKEALEAEKAKLMQELDQANAERQSLEYKYEALNKQDEFYRQAFPILRGGGGGRTLCKWQ
ncbi:MAG: DUF4164 domain-containing protein [Holosporales bacterium]|jgi:regulator of replication initiation timing|nr:DUF4164 domain-containing protein [Holosporales bacterium]